jgi:TonB family protein
MTEVGSPDPPKLATWLMEQFSPLLQNAPLAGDLVESFKDGRSSNWYCRQVFWAILIGLLNLFRRGWRRLRATPPMKEVRMSRPKLVGSLAIVLVALVTVGWWATKTFWLAAQSTHPTPMIFYGSGAMEGGRCFGCPVVSVSEVYVGDTQIKGPVPVSMHVPHYTPLAQKNKVWGAVVALVDVDASGGVAGVKLTKVDLSSSISAGLEQGVNNTLLTWKFKPATEKGKPVPATVQAQVNFFFDSL